LIEENMTKKTVKAAVLGAAGRMGQRIIHFIAQSEGIALHGAVERAEHPLLGQNVQDFVNIPGLQVKLTDDLRNVLPEIDVVIDFTDARGTLTTIDAIAAAKKAVVIGTTGLSAPESDGLKKKLSHVPCVFSPNMSVGVNLMFQIVGNVARILKDDYDVEIVEAHHRMKKDAPSGTAVRLADILAESLERDIESVGTYGRKGVIGERKPQEIGIHAVRGGDIVGEHTVLFAGLGERIEITHRAHSRDTFAAGAVKAARWIVDQPPGIYGMGDVLGFNDEETVRE
jgi:4-hydroxy-tetrahydrodipicolinate reductase